jgi:hypothetical protein
VDENEDAAEVIAETEHFVVWRTDDEDDVAYHVELGSVTLHLDEEEWQELVELVRGA